MKRISLILIALLVLGSAMYAAVGAVSGTSIDAIKDTPVEQVVSFTIGDNDSFKFGFSTDGKPSAFSGEGDVLTANQLDATTLTISASDSTVADNAGSPLHVWWDITTNDIFDVSLSIDQALTYTPVAGGSESTIDWTVTGVDGTDADKISLASNVTTSQDFIKLESDATIQHFEGSQQLTIETVTGDDANGIVGKPVGTYTATLTLGISTNG